MQLLLLVSLIAVCFGENVDLKLDFTDSKVNDLKGQDALDAFTGKSQITGVYFYKRAIKNFEYFVRDFKLAAMDLEVYQVSLGFVDCTTEVNKDVNICDISEVEGSIHTYRSGEQKMLFQLRHLYSAHSIVGNILQLVLLRDVPLLRNETEVGIYLEDHKGGKKDLVLAYFPTLGSYDHRAFLEVAYANKDNFQFAIIMDTKSTKYFGDGKRILKNVPTLWWVWASDSSFTSVKYGRKFSQKDLTIFINTISKPKLFDIPGDGIEHPFSSFEVPLVKLYYNAASKDKVYEEADVLIRYFGGAIGIIVVNMDNEEAKSKYKVEEELPTLSFQRNAEANEEFIPSDFNSPSILNYISITLNEKPVTEMVEEGLEETSDQSEDPPFNMEEVSTQDDAVADAVYVTRKVELPLSLVPALNDKTFPKYIKDSDTAVVMFYFHFDALSHGNIRMFGEAADKLGKQTTIKLGRVSCFDWTDVCQKEKLTIFPTLRIYKKGEMAWDYKGPQDTQAFYSTLKLLELSPPVYETDKNKLMQYIDGNGESTLTGVTNTTVVGLFRKKDKKEREIFEEFARSSRERIMFVYTDIKEAGDIAKNFGASVPTVILSKYDDSLQPYAKFDDKFTLQNLQDFVDNNKLPKLTVLTPLMFPEIRRRFSELLILFTDNKDK
ncbi:thioredoxin domain-containing protein 16-like, partial [Ruditapes philippinarum]|uniref:thioredoxin domain-containing protein 16-like n=1 Tax=Ruditapes philippinarum TaxID=129788 RepID=UPI00295A8CDB